MAAITSAATGNWNATGTWTGGVVPTATDTVTIQAAHTVTVNVTTAIAGNDVSSTTAASNGIYVLGTLKASRTVSSTLTCRGTLSVGVGGTLDWGTVADPIPAAFTATLNVNDSASLSTGKHYVIGQSGHIFFYGKVRTRNTTMTAASGASATSIQVADATGWVSGDRIAVMSATANPTGSQVVTISGAVTGSGPYTVPVTAVTVARSIGTEVSNLSSNVIVKAMSANFPGGMGFATGSGQTSTVEIHHTRFENMGSAGSSWAQSFSPRYLSAVGVDIANADGSFAVTNCAFEQTGTTGCGAVSAMSPGFFGLVFEDCAVMGGQRLAYIADGATLLADRNVVHSISTGVESAWGAGSSAGTIIRGGVICTSSTASTSAAGQVALTDVKVKSSATSGYSNGTGSLTITGGSVECASGIHRYDSAAASGTAKYDSVTFVGATPIALGSATIGAESAVVTVNAASGNQLDNRAFSSYFYAQADAAVRNRGLRSLKMNCARANITGRYSYTIPAVAGTAQRLIGYLRFDTTYGTANPPSISIAGSGVNFSFTAPATANTWHKFDTTVTPTASGTITVTMTVLSTSTTGFAYLDGLGGSAIIPNTWHYGFRNRPGSAAVTADPDITATEATVAAMTSADDLGDVYDMLTYWSVTNPADAYTSLATVVGTAVDFGDRNVVFTGASVPAVAYNSGTNTVTIKASTVAATAELTSITTTGTVSTASGATIAGSVVVTSSAGTTTTLNLTGLSGHSVAVYNNSGTRQVFAANQTGTYTFIAPAGSAGTWSFRITRHGYTVHSANFTPSGGIQSVAQGTTLDPSVTQTTAATVAAYTTLETLARLYDYLSYWYTTTTGIDSPNLASKNGVAVDLGARNITFNATAGSVFTYSATGAGTLTAKATTVSAGGPFTQLTTTGTVAVSNGASIDATVVVASTAGTTTNLSLTGLSAHAVAVYNNSGVRQAYTASHTGTYTFIAPAGSSGTWSYRITKHGYTAHTGTFAATGGFVTAAQTTTVDTAVTQTTAATVAAYTTLETLAKLYDYSSYWQTTSAGIDVVKFTTKSGAALDVGSQSVTVDATAGSAWAYNAGTTTLTVKATSLAAGGGFTSLTTTGTVAVANGGSIDASVVVTSTAGTTTNISLTGLSSHSVAIYNQAGTRQVFAATQSGTYTYIIPAGSTGTWTYRLAKYGHSTQTGNLATTGGFITVAAATTADTGITEATVATVAAYATLGTLARIYDYLSYWYTTTTGIDTLGLATKDGATLNLGARDLTVDATAASVLAYSTTGDGTLTAKASTLTTGGPFTALSTTGDVATANGATIDAAVIVTSAAGTTGVLAITGLIAASSIAVYDGSDAEQDYVASSGTTYSFAVPAAATGTWRWVIKKPGYAHQMGTFSADGSTSVTAAQAQILNPDGSAMYAGTSSTLVDVGFTGTTQANIDIGNGSAALQAVYDESERALITTEGMAWLNAGKSDVRQFDSPAGDFLFLSTGWRLRRREAGDASATLAAFAQSADGVVVDGVNGGVAFLTSDSPTAIAAAVWAATERTLTDYTLPTGERIVVLQSNGQMLARLQ